MSICPGDLRQCLPLIKNGSRSQTLDATIIRSSFWHQVKMLPLRINMRLGENPVPATSTFARWLLNIGEGLAHTVTGQVDLPARLWFVHPSSRDDLIHKVYIDLQSLDCTIDNATRDYFQDPIILAAHNHTVNQLIKLAMQCMPGKERDRSADVAVMNLPRLSKFVMICPDTFSLLV